VSTTYEAFSGALSSIWSGGKRLMVLQLVPRGRRVRTLYCRTENGFRIPFQVLYRRGRPSPAPATVFSVPGSPDSRCVGRGAPALNAEFFVGKARGRWSILVFSSAGLLPILQTRASLRDSSLPASRPGVPTRWLQSCQPRSQKAGPRPRFHPPPPPEVTSFHGPAISRR
jgi:hypothetical protein